MKKEKKHPKENKEKKSSGKEFLKKRAPIYLAVITLVIVFVIPELTAGTLEDYIPKDLSGNEKRALEIFLSYRGPNNVGLNSIDVISEKINENYPDEKIFDKKDTDVKFLVSPIDDADDENYPDEKIFDKKDTDVKFLVSPIDDLDDENYKILLDFKTKNESLSYEWHVNIITGKLTSVNSDAKKILEIVDYSK